jgi:C-terminal processing protease CtpA/Prc
MRRLILTVLGLVALGAGGYGVWIATADDPISRLPRWIQTRPSFYLDSALHRIEQHGFGHAAVDWTAVRQHATEMASGARSTDETSNAIRYAINQLPDHLSLYVAPPAAGTAGLGYGVQVLFPERVVATVYPKSAAAQAGIHPGDIIEQVEGHPPMVNRDARARGAFIELRPPSAVLHVRQPSGQSRDVPLDAASFELLPADTHRIGGDLGYVFLPGTPGPEGFVAAVRTGIVKADDPGVCGWIVDLRRNTGGAMWPMLQALRPIIGEAPIGSFVDGAGAKTPWAYPQDADGAPAPLAHPNSPVAVLTSRLTAGAAEAVVVAFRGRLATRSFGEPTWGTPTSTETYSLVDGATLVLTSAFDADRTGFEYHSRIAPDEAMPIDWARIGAPDDPIVVAAGTWLRAQTACKKH